MKPGAVPRLHAPMLYELKNLQKRFGRHLALDVEELPLEKGKVIGLLGPNGAGKTTLLEILGFLQPPSSGEIRFQGKRVDFTSNSLTHLRRKVVLVQQHPIMFTATVSKNLEFPLRIRKTPRGDAQRLVAELLDLVGMGEFRDARADKLSGGETQRIAIARALACTPEVILFDEPTANVDVEHQISVERIIREINREKGISLIFTTHDMIQASRLADEIVFLFEGRLARSTYENIFSAYLETGPGGDRHCLIQNRLRLKLHSRESGPARIAIDPAAVVISADGEGSEGFANTFKGKLIQVTDEHERVRALVDVGIPLTALISKTVFRNLSLAVGEEVWLTCPAEAIEVF